MIRPFDLRDIGVVRQLESDSITLDSQRALIHAHRPLRGAMLAYLMAKRGTPTFVMRARQAEGTLRAYGQLKISADKPQARLVALAAAGPANTDPAWEPMLDALTAYAGRCGAYALLAEVEDSSELFEALRRADFAVYTRQEIWRLTQVAAPPAESLLRPEQSSDAWHIQQLISNIVPRLIQQVETVKPAGQGLLWKDQDSTLAYVRAQVGARGTWMQLYLHPQAEEAVDKIIQQTAAHYAPSDKAPLYCCVRRYQEWLNRPLAEHGFEPLGSQAVMVRHTTVRLAQPEKLPVAVAEQSLEVTTPLVRSKSQ